MKETKKDGFKEIYVMVYLVVNKKGDEIKLVPKTKIKKLFFCLAH